MGSILELTARLRPSGVVPIVTLAESDLAVPVMQALTAGGISCVEVTFRTKHAAPAVAAIRAKFPSVLVGAGTILSLETARTAIDAGAEFLVAPGTNPEVVSYAATRGTPMLPGIATPSEIEANLARGITLMKLFPADLLGGPAYVRALGGPYPDLLLVPTGGVSAENLADYLAQPNVVACGGSWIAPERAIVSRDWSAIARNASNAATVVRRYRESPALMASSAGGNA